MIAIFSNYSDMHAQAVAWALEQCGERVVVMDAINESLAPASIGIKDGVATSTFSPSAVWWRRPGLSRVNRCCGKKFKRFVTNEWFEYAHTTSSLLQGSAFWVNDRYKAHLAASKAYQLLSAHTAGMQTPDTLISNNCKEVKAFISHNRKCGAETIAKCFTPHQWVSYDSVLRLQNTSKVTVDDIDQSNLELSPAIFQPYIEPLYEIRVTVIGDHVLPMRISDASNHRRSKPGDWRQFLSLDDFSKSTFSLPKSVEYKLRTLMQNLGLVFAAIDLIVDKHNNYIFLELNESGNFLFCEEYCPQLNLLASFAALVLSQSPTIDVHLINSSVSFSAFMKAKSLRKIPRASLDQSRLFVTRCKE